MSEGRNPLREVLARLDHAEQRHSPGNSGEIHEVSFDVDEWRRFAHDMQMAVEHALESDKCLDDVVSETFWHDRAGGDTQ